MRLCFVTREFPPFTRYSGGIGSQYAALAPELVRQGHDVHVVSPARRAGEFEDQGVRFHLTPWLRVWQLENPSWSIAADRRLRTLGGFDVVYAAEWGADAWRYSRHQANGPLVTNLQISLAQVHALSTGLPVTARIKPRVPITERLEREQAERSRAVVGCSRAVLRWAGELWRLDTVPDSSVLPNTTNVARVRRLAQAAPAPGYPEQRPLVAFSGRLETRKGIAELAEAMRDVWRLYPTAQLVLLGGDFPYRSANMSDHVRGVAGEFAGNVHVLGNQPPERLFPSLAAADVVALPSRWEAFGIAALEAMALGKAVVLTSGSGYDDFATDGHDALVVPPGDARELGAAIGRLLGDSALRTRVASVATQTADRFDVPVVARAHADYFAALGVGKTGQEPSTTSTAVL